MKNEVATFVRLRYFPVEVTRAWLDIIPHEVLFTMSKIWPATTMGLADDEDNPLINLRSLSVLYMAHKEDFDSKLFYWLCNHHEYYGV